MKNKIQQFRLLVWVKLSCFDRNGNSVGCPCVVSVAVGMFPLITHKALGAHILIRV